MPKRHTGVYKRKDGRWEGRYLKGRRPDGTALYGSVYGKSCSEVRDKLINMSTSTENNDSLRNKSYSFEDILVLWLNNNRIHHKGGTNTKYQNLLKAHIIPDLGRIDIDNITASMINNYLLKKLNCGRLDGKGGLSPSYVQSMMVIINSALRFAEKEGLCTPLKSSIYKPVIKKKELSILEYEEQKRLEAFLYSDINPFKLGVLISLNSGMRIGEICALRWSNVDLDNQIISVHHTISRIATDDNKSLEYVIDSPKTRASYRAIPIVASLQPVIAKEKLKSTSEYVVSTDGLFTKPRNFDYQFHKILKECGIRPINFHTLRHTFATRCIEAGVDVKSLSEILGHSNVSITLNTYVHSSINMKRNQLAKLERYNSL